MNSRRRLLQDDGGKFTHRGKRTAESVIGFVVREAAPGSRSKLLLQVGPSPYTHTHARAHTHTNAHTRTQTHTHTHPVANLLSL